MTVIIGEMARSIIGVDFAATWAGLSEMLADMEGPKKGPNAAHINQATIKKYKSNTQDKAVGDRCRKLAESLMSSVPEMQKSERKLKRIWADDDGELNIERYINDEERYWRRLQRPRRPCKTIRLMAEISATGYTSDADIELRCALIVALSTWLIEYGYEAEVLAADYSHHFFAKDDSIDYDYYNTYYNKQQDTGTELGTVIVKSASEDLNVDNLAAILCSHDFGYNALLRAIVHVCPKKCSSYWGSVVNIPDNVLKALEVDVSVPRFVESHEQAKKWLSKAVKKLSIANNE